MPDVRQGPPAGLKAAAHARVGLFLAAAVAGLSPWLLGWALLAQGRVAAPLWTDAVVARRLDPPARVAWGPHLPKGCALMLKRARPGLWSLLVRREGPDERLLRPVKCLRPGTAAWILRGQALPLDIAWPVWGVARPPRTFDTTGYDPGPQDNTRGWVDTTRSGSRARFGIVAVDPRVIPLGTRVYVEGYGPGLAADIGGAIKGRRIDLCFNTSSQARDWGRRRRRVWIVDPAPRKDRRVLQKALAGGL